MTNQFFFSGISWCYNLASYDSRFRHEYVHIKVEQVVIPHWELVIYGIGFYTNTFTSFFQARKYCECV